MRLSRWPVLAVALLTLAGCTDRTEHDSDPPATTTTATDRAGAAALPAGFPSAVPVVIGTIEGDYLDPGMPGGGIWTLSVTGVDAGAYDKAEQLLLGAGFQRDDQPGPSMPHRCARTSVFNTYPPGADGYVVLLCGNPTEPQYVLEYTVNVYPPGG